MPLRKSIREKGILSYFTIYIVCTYIYHKNVKWPVFIKFRNMICPQKTLCLRFLLFSHKTAINVPNSNKEQFYVHNVSLSSSKKIYDVYDIVQKFWEGHKILKKSPTLYNYKNLIYTAFAAKFLKYIVWLTTTLTRHCAKNEACTLCCRLIGITARNLSLFPDFLFLNFSENTSENEIRKGSSINYVTSLYFNFSVRYS